MTFEMNDAFSGWRGWKREIKHENFEVRRTLFEQEFIDLGVMLKHRSQKSTPNDVFEKNSNKNTARSSDNVGEANKIDKTPTYP